ncbi:oxidation resistance protein 1 isoform X2 [Olea europaea var. sylvestris]|uniref:oxidation resistance protein 1 isoform X2 n=1 Tax=Olea europaea var. sylvestris TaxID=158386 RepID=UPI000C1CEBAD|nr:oxidation resistance protein 1 isoform X2 [Olea europaea var. sylvestris]
MHAIKERFSETLSKNFSDSPSSQMPDQKPEARPYTNEGKSILSFILPSAGLDWFRSNNRNNEEFGEHVSVRGLSQNNESSPCVENGEPGSRRSTCSSTDVFEDAADSYSFEKTMPNLTVESLFISPDLYEFFDSSLPNIVKGCQWVLIYSTVRHGISLRTLIRKSADLSGPCLLITGDKQGAVFGGLLECPLKPTAKRKYQGTNQTFVFTTIYGEPRLFRPTGANRYFYLCLNDLIALGGGANFALRLNEDLLSGTSGPCETFGNLCLAHDQEFELKNVELWGFTHVSQYLN